MPLTTSRRHFLGLLAGTLTLPAASSAAVPRGQPEIRLKRGMNMWPWFSLTREYPAPRTDFGWPPLQTDRPVPRRNDLLALKRAGIDFIRVPVDPGPFIAFAGERRAELFAEIRDALNMTLSAGLAAVINLQANAATHYFTPQNMVSDVSQPLFAGYADLVAAMAALLADFDPARVALEPVNEPPQACDAPSWTAVQAALVRRARAAAPRLTLVLTGSCGSMIAGLTELDPASIGDDNVLYTFHFYEPYVFTHQGAGWMTGEPMYPYLDSVPWPSPAGSKASTLAAIARRLAADRTMPSAQRRALTATIRTVIDQYFAPRRIAASSPAISTRSPHGPIAMASAASACCLANSARCAPITGAPGPCRPIAPATSPTSARRQRHAAYPGPSGTSSVPWGWSLTISRAASIRPSSPRWACRRSGGT